MSHFVYKVIKVIIVIIIIHFTYKMPFQENYCLFHRENKEEYKGMGWMKLLVNISVSSLDPISWIVWTMTATFLILIGICSNYYWPVPLEFMTIVVHYLILYNFQHLWCSFWFFWFHYCKLFKIYTKLFCAIILKQIITS